MNPTMGWALAGAALLAGWFGWGWQGLVLAITVIVFWLLLQFSRTLRVLRGAAGSPVGHVANAVMLHARLRKGLRLADIIGMTRSLGQRTSESPERFVWRDGGGDEVEVELHAGRTTAWALRRASNGSTGQRPPDAKA